MLSKYFDSTKKKELVGDFKNGGRAWRRKGEPHRVHVHDFIIRDPRHGKAILSGSTISVATKGGSVSGLTTTQPAARSMRFAGGGNRWARRLSPRTIARDHRGRRWQQWPARPPLELGTAAARQSDRIGDHGVSFSTGHEQVEQDCKWRQLARERAECPWKKAPLRTPQRMTKPSISSLTAQIGR